jgi:hypothetical protein
MTSTASRDGVVTTPAGPERATGVRGAVGRHAVPAGGAAVSALVAVGYGLVLLVNRRFFHHDDTEAYYVGMWLRIGRGLRDGEFPVLDPGMWMVGNFPVESQTGLWNPVLLLISWLSPSFERQVVFTTLVALVFAVLLGVGIYRVALAHGARVRWAVVAGTAAPFTGWALYYDAGSWIISTLCLAFVANAWASLVHLVDGRSGPLPAFAWLYLDMSTGFPYGVLAGALVTVGVLAHGLARQAGPRALLRTALAALAAALCAAVTYLPALLSYDATFRADLDETVSNTGFMVVPWSESLGVLLPTYLPQVQTFGGLERVPGTYIAWFLLPALALLDWRRVGRRLASLAGPLTLLVLWLVVTSGPTNLGPFRWPTRFLPYLAMAVLVGLAVAASAGIGTSRPRLRAAALGAVLGVGTLRALSSTPAEWERHLRALLLVGALCLAAGAAWRWGGERALAAVLALSVLPVVAMQVTYYDRNLNTSSWGFPSDHGAARAVFPELEGSTLQLGDAGLTRPDERNLEQAWSRLTFANYALGLGRDYVNGYTPVGHAPFGRLLCMNHVGTTCGGAGDRLFATERRTGRTYADLLGVQNVVVQRAQYPGVHQDAPPPGWTRTLVDDRIAVLEREGPPSPGPGAITAARGATVRPLATSSRETRAQVTSDTGGLVVLARLHYEGYRASLDGRPAQLTALDEVFVAVELPPGTRDAELVVRFDPPGWRAGAALAALGALLLVGLAAERRRRPAQAAGQRQASRSTR